MSNTVKQLGFIPTNRGEFDTTGQTRYYKDNVVQYRNGSYICTPVGYSTSNPTAYTTDAPYQDGDTELNPNWELMASVGLVDEAPTSGSDNLVKSGGVQNKLTNWFEAISKGGSTMPSSANEGDYYLFAASATNNRIYQYLSGSWNNITSSFNYKNMVWRVIDTGRYYYKASNSLTDVYYPLDDFMESFVKKSFFLSAILVGSDAPSSDLGSNDDFYLRNISETQGTVYKKVNGSWIDAENTIYQDYGNNVIWEVSGRWYFRFGYRLSFRAIDKYAIDLIGNVRDKQIKFYNLYSDNNNTKFATKQDARQYWGNKFGYTNSAGTVLFYVLTDNTFVFEQKISDVHGSETYYQDVYYKNIVLGEAPVRSDFLSEDNSLATILNKPLTIQKYQERLGSINYNNITNSIIDGELFIKSSTKEFGNYYIVIPQNNIFSCELDFYAQNAGSLSIDIYDSTDSTYIYQITKTLIVGHNKVRIHFKPDGDISAHSVWIRFKANNDVGTIYLKDSTRYYTVTKDNPLLLTDYTENDIEDSLSDMGRKILFKLVDYAVTVTTTFGYQIELGYGGNFYFTIKKTGNTCPFVIYGSNTKDSSGDIIYKIDQAEDLTTEKTFLLKLDKSKKWFLKFRTFTTGVTIDKLIIERPVSKSSLTEWDGKTISIYGDSIAAMTDSNNGRGPIWNADSLDYGQKIAHYFHLGGVYGRGIGSQMYKWNNGHGGSLCWVDSVTGQFKARLNNRTYDDYLNPSLTDTVVAEATAAGYDSNTMLFCRGSLSSWDRITKMYPASIKDTIDAIIVMSVNDSYDDETNHTWLDYAFVENDETDPEWAASTYYDTYGGDYNIGTSLQGGVASTIMKLQAWMPQARILLCVSGAGGRYNTVHPELAEQEYTKYDSFIKMHRLLSCPLIDIYGTAGINGLNCMNYLADGIHPYTAAGSRAYAAAIIGAMKGVILHSSLL